MPNLIWAVNGSKFSAESARAETFKNTNGARGVTLPTDLKVSALPTPGAAVRVNPGGASLPAGYAAAPGQSYSVTVPTSVDVPVTATGSGGAAVKYLLLRLKDPQYEGTAPADPVNFDYSSFVWVTSLTGIAYPYVPLVKLTQPASTATITNAMLTDIRKLARARVDREVTSSSNGVVSTITATGSVGEPWLNYTVTHEVPEWANWVHIIVHVSGYVQTAALADAEIWPRIGGVPLGGSLVLDHDGLIDGQRYSLTATASGAIPGFSGTFQKIDVVGRRLAVSNHPGLIRADASTHIAYDIQFEERIL